MTRGTFMVPSKPRQAAFPWFSRGFLMLPHPVAGLPPTPNRTWAAHPTSVRATRREAP